MAHHIPIVAMTACAIQGDREMCLRAGMDGYVSKPISVTALYQAIEEFAAMPGAAKP
jgi:CheY-like chemotaxis protein